MGIQLRNAFERDAKLSAQGQDAAKHIPSQRARVTYDLAAGEQCRNLSPVDGVDVWPGSAYGPNVVPEEPAARPKNPQHLGCRGQPHIVVHDRREQHELCYQVELMTRKRKDVRTADAQVRGGQAKTRRGNSILHEVDSGHPRWVSSPKRQPLKFDTGPATDIENVEIAKGTEPIPSQRPCDPPLSALRREQRGRSDRLVQIDETRIGIATAIHGSRTVKFCVDVILVHS
jgi:hypothetical protein